MGAGMIINSIPIYLTGVYVLFRVLNNPKCRRVEKALRWFGYILIFLSIYLLFDIYGDLADVVRVVNNLES